MNDDILHDRENSEDTGSFLKENGKKFTGDCLIAMKLMYQGVKLNGDTCKELYGIHDRRLRNCRQWRPDLVKSQWAKDENGKRKYVEYWIEKPQPPTKADLQKWFTEWQNEQPTKTLTQQNLFDL